MVLTITNSYSIIIYRERGKVVRAGEIIKEERIKRGWTQSRLASKIGVSQPMINDLELGKKGAGDDTKKAIAKIFNLPIMYIFFNDEYNK